MASLISMAPLHTQTMTEPLPVHAQETCSGGYWPAPAAKNMADMIQNQVRDMLRNSRLVRKADNIQLVRRDDIVHVNQILGSGAFSQVSAVTLRDGRQYACKHLKEKLMDQPDNFRLAAAEMACEAHMLASFDHPHILKIRGWSYNGIASFEEGYHNSFFLLLDQLEETLDNRITRWHTEEQQQQQLILSNPGMYDEHYHLKMYMEKLHVLSGIGSALEYLHEHGVIFRDLKPNNIGFLNGNQVQLFDFGLSRELPQLDTSVPFEMSGKVGTLRYMAPEIALHQAYNVSADVFSLAMVAYEMLSLQKPFDGWTRDMHSNLVCTRGMRPDLTLTATTIVPSIVGGGTTTSSCNRIPVEMRLLLERAWSDVPANRPTVPYITTQVEFFKEQQRLMLEEERLRMQVFQIQQQQQEHQVVIEPATMQPTQTFYVDTEFLNQQQQQQQIPMFIGHQQQPMPGDRDQPIIIDIPEATSPNGFCYDLPLQNRNHQRGYGRKMVRCNSFDSIGTIETESLSAESQEFFF